MILSTSDIIQIVAIVITLIASTASIIIAIKSLKQTNKSITDANRPYLVIYSDFMQIQSERMNYLIIKNFGKTGAIIDSITYSNNDFYANSNKPFYNFSSCSIAPNQTYLTRVLYKKSPYIPFDITIKYHDNISEYTDTYSINTEAIAKQLVGFTTFSDQGDLEKAITISTQEIIRRSL